MSTKGSGEPLLFLPPLGASAALWSAFTDALAARCLVLSLEPPAGFLTTRQLARFAVSALNGHGLDRVTVYGQSLGGMVAQWLSIEASVRVRRLVLASTSAQGARFARAGLVRGLGFMRCLTRPAGEAGVCLARRVLSPNFVEQHPDRLHEIERLLRREARPRSRLIAEGLSGALHATGSRLADIGAETLCLGGALDALLGDEPQRSLAGAIPNARFETIDEVGHDIALEAPDETARRVHRFMGLA